MSELYKGSQPGPWKAGEPFSAETPARPAESRPMVPEANTGRSKERTVEQANGPAGHQPIEQRSKPDATYVAWLRYAPGPGDGKCVVTCDSDAPGAFKVYRQSESSAIAERRIAEARLEEAKNGMPIYLEIHKGHRSGHLNFGVMTGLIQDFTLEQMQEFRQMLCVVIGISEEAFRSGDQKRNPASQAEPAGDKGTTR